MLLELEPMLHRQESAALTFLNSENCVQVKTSRKQSKTGVKAETRRQSPGQVVKPRTGAKAEDRQENQGQATKLWTGYKAENRRES